MGSTSIPWAGVAENGNLRERFSTKCPVDLRKDIVGIRYQVDVIEDYNPNPTTSPGYDPFADPFLLRKKTKFDVTFNRVFIPAIRESLLRDPSGGTTYYENRGDCFPNSYAVFNSADGLEGSLNDLYAEKVPDPLPPGDDDDNYRVFKKGDFLLIGDRCCPLKQMMFSRGVDVEIDFNTTTHVLTAGYVENIYVPLSGPHAGEEDYTDAVTGDVFVDLPELFCYECKAGIPVWNGPAPVWETPLVPTTGDNVTFTVANSVVGDATHDAVVLITAVESGPVTVVQYFKWVAPDTKEFIFKVEMLPRENGTLSSENTQQLYHFVPGEPGLLTNYDPPRVWWRDHDTRFARNTQSWPNVSVSVVAINGVAFVDTKGATTGKSETGCFLFSARLKADGFAGVAQIAFIGPYARKPVSLPVRDTAFVPIDVRKSILWRAGTQPATDYIKEPWAYDYIFGGDLYDPAQKPYKLNVMEVARDINPASWSRSFDKYDPTEPFPPYSDMWSIRRYGTITYSTV